MRLRLDILFEHTHILLTIPAPFPLYGVYGMKGEFVVSTAHTLHATIYEVGIELPTHSLTARDNGGILVEEGHPFWFGAAWGTLVSNESQEGLLAIAHHGDNGA